MSSDKHVVYTALLARREVLGNQMRSCILLHSFIKFMTFLVHWKIPSTS